MSSRGWNRPADLSAEGVNWADMKENARAAAELIPVSEHLVTKQDIVALEVKMWRMGVTVASLAVLLNKFLDWVIPGK